MEVDQDSGVFSLSLPDCSTQAEHATQWRVNGADHNDYAPAHRLRLEDYLANVLGGVTTTNLQNTKISLLDATTLPGEQPFTLSCKAARPRLCELWPHLCTVESVGVELLLLCIVFFSFMKLTLFT